MELASYFNSKSNLWIDDAIFRDPNPEETSRFLNIIDSPKGSEDGTNKINMDPKNQFFQISDNKEEVTEDSKICSYFPTKVVLAKNLPQNSTELDIHSVWEVFGVVKKVFNLIQINNAFIEFENKESAQKWVNSNWKPDGPTIRNSRIKFYFTGREEIVLEGSDKDFKNNILLVTISNIRIPIDIHTLAAVFNNYGNVQRLVMFTRIHGLQALIEMKDIQQAEECFSNLNNKDLYPNWNTLKIQYSSQTKLEITKECKTSIDFTKHSSETGDFSEAFGNGAYSHGKFWTLLLTELLEVLV